MILVGSLLFFFFVVELINQQTVYLGPKVTLQPRGEEQEEEEEEEGGEGGAEDQRRDRALTEDCPRAPTHALASLGGLPTQLL